jgi:MFS family permease
MTNVFLKTWALFLGFAIISLAHGLQGTLLGVRAVFEGFSIISTGFIVAGYYVGYLSGSIIIPILLKRVGHRLLYFCTQFFFNHICGSL